MAMMDDSEPQAGAPEAEGGKPARRGAKGRAPRAAASATEGQGPQGKPVRARAARRAAGAAAGGEADGAAGQAAGAAMKTRDFVDRVAKVSGMKRRAAKPVVEAVLAELGLALGEGRPLSLRPLGKITVTRTRERGGGPVMVCRIRPHQPKRRGGAEAGGDTGGDKGLAAPDAEALAQSGEGR
jgi:DNA-binding protein HU-alpha